MPNSRATVKDDLDRTVTDYHLALAAFFKGDPEPCKRLSSHKDDVSLANPFGPPACGWSLVAQTMEQAAAHYRDGRATGFDRVAEYTTGDLAYIVEIEHFEAKIGEHVDTAPSLCASLRCFAQRTAAGRSFTVTRTRSQPPDLRSRSFIPAPSLDGPTEAVPSTSWRAGQDGDGVDEWLHI